MKNNVADGLDKTLNVESQFEVMEDIMERDKEILSELAKTDTQDIDLDYKYARENLYGVIEKGSEALDTLIDLAKASEHPRAFEVVSQLTKTLVDANKDLLDIQKKVKDLKKTEEAAKPQNVTNALFVGSTAELQKLVNGRNEDG
jgi:valyl-tRNA synthetase